MEIKASAGHMSCGDPPAPLQDIRLVVDTIPKVAWSTSPDGSADFFNPRWLEYTGLIRCWMMPMKRWPTSQSRNY